MIHITRSAKQYRSLNFKIDSKAKESTKYNHICLPQTKSGQKPSIKLDSLDKSAKKTPSKYFKLQKKFTQENISIK
jgi:hypothetical protein